MTDPVGDAARAAALILAADLGPRLPAEVEAALAARAIRQRANRFLDPVSLGALIVSIATLAWTIYNDQRKHTPEPPTESVTRQVRIAVRDQDLPLPGDADRIIEVIATEVISRADRDDPHS